MKLQTESISNNETELNCPSCGFNYLKHEKVEIFEREEDGDIGLHVSVEK